MIKIFINHGRYMATCPKCGNHHVVDHLASTLICPACWHGLNAKKMEQDQYGAWVLVPHDQKIAETREQARTAGEEYELEFPPKGVIEILRPRSIENMNWIPGETLDFLREENHAHGLEGI